MARSRRPTGPRTSRRSAASARRAANAAGTRLTSPTTVLVFAPRTSARAGPVAAESASRPPPDRPGRSPAYPRRCRSAAATQRPRTPALRPPRSARKADWSSVSRTAAAPRRAWASWIAATASSSAIGRRAAQAVRVVLRAVVAHRGHVDGAGGRLEALLQRLGDEGGADGVAGGGVVGVADARGLPLAASPASARPCGGGRAATPGSGRGRGRRPGWDRRRRSRRGRARTPRRGWPARPSRGRRPSRRRAAGRAPRPAPPRAARPAPAAPGRRPARPRVRPDRVTPRASASSATRSPRSRRSSGCRSARKVSSGSTAGAGILAGCPTRSPSCRCT